MWRPLLENNFIKLDLRPQKPFNSMQTPAVVDRLETRLFRMWGTVRGFQDRFAVGSLASRTLRPLVSALRKSAFATMSARRKVFSYLRRSDLFIAEFLYERPRTREQIAASKRYHQAVNEYGERLNTILKRTFYPLLKSLGFRKKGRYFFRQVGEAQQVLTLKSIYWNDTISGTIVITAGVYFSKVAQVLDSSSTAPKVAKEFQWTTRRAARVAPRRDEYRLLNSAPDMDLAVVDGDLLRVLNHQILPWLEKVKTISGAAPEMGTLNNMLPEVAARIVLGENEKAAQLIRLSIDYYKSAIATATLENKYRIALHIKKLNDWGAAHKLAGFSKS